MSDTPLLAYNTKARAPHQLPGMIVLIVAAAMVLVGVPLLYAGNVIGITTINQLGRFLAIAIAAVGLDLVWGYTGILSLCQAMFFVFGGYAIGMHLALHGPLDGDGIPRCLFVVSSEVSGTTLPWFWVPFRSLPVALFLGLFLPGLFAYLFGFFSFRSRVRGVYFSIITQATTIAAFNFFCMNNVRLCGTNGLTNFVTLGGFDLQSPNVKLGLYLITATILSLIFIGGKFLTRSRLGRMLVAVRDNESRLRFAGFQPVTFKVFIFALGAVLAGLGGMLYTPQNGIITPFKMDPAESIFIVACVAVGGRGTLSGAVLGAIIVNFLQSFLTSGLFYNYLPAFLRMHDGDTGMLKLVRRQFQIILGPDGWLIVLGAIFIAVTLFFPEGIVGAWRRLLSGGKGELDAAVDADEASSDQEEGRETVVSYTPAPPVAPPVEEHA